MTLRQTALKMQCGSRTICTTAAISAPHSISHKCTGHRQRKRSIVVRAADARASQQNILEKAVNSLSELVTKSPLNEGKKKWFQRMAGDYDKEATQQKIHSLIEENAVRSCSERAQDQDESWHNMSKYTWCLLQLCLHSTDMQAGAMLNCSLLHQIAACK